MADINKLSDLIRQSSFYSAGGKDVDSLDKVNTVLDTANKGISGYQEILNNVLKQKSERLAQQKSKLGIGQSEYEQSLPQRDLANRLTESVIEKNLREKQLPPTKKFLTEKEFRDRTTKGEVLSPNEYTIVPDPSAGERPKTYISESEWRKRSAAGEQFSARDYQIVPDTAPTENAGTIPPDKAGMYTLAQESVKSVDNVIKTLFPSGTPESFRRNVAAASNIPGSNLPVIGAVIPNAMPFDKDAQNVNRWIGNALSGRQLIQTGVSARPDETQSLVRRFMSSIVSDPTAAQEALKELQGFYQDYNTTLITRKPLPPRPTPHLDAMLSGGKVENQSIKTTQSPKPGGVLSADDQGNKAWVYPDGTFDEVK